MQPGLVDTHVDSEIAERELRSKGRLLLSRRCSIPGSHLKSIQMILDGRAEAAAVDSITLAGFFAERPELTDCFHVVKSLGPHPVYALVFNSRLPGKHGIPPPSPPPSLN